jgi:sphingolipid 4-desaturase/C4-monooxygenase
MLKSSFTVVNYPEPHIGRTRQIMAKYPEIKKLFGNTPSTLFYILGVVGLQIAVAASLSFQDCSWWVILAASWTVGALANHALWTLIHDATHNLVFKGSTANKMAALLANLPIVFPSAITFRIYHLQHHRYQGEMNKDADLAIPMEVKLAGRSPIGKAIWFLLFPFFQPFRVAKLDIEFFDRWVIVNFITSGIFLATLGYFAGLPALAYLFLSSCFSVGLHPVGARWIQEHYTVVPNQETYSYYGPLNRIAFNVGYHNEHHDLMMVPWSRLPQVKAMAPEFYDNLHSHKSWTGLLLKFLFDPNLTLNSRIVREPKKMRASAEPVSSTQDTMSSASAAVSALTASALPATPTQ